MSIIAILCCQTNIKVTTRHKKAPSSDGYVKVHCLKILDGASNEKESILLCFPNHIIPNSEIWAVYAVIHKHIPKILRDKLIFTISSDLHDIDIGSVLGNPNLPTNRDSLNYRRHITNLLHKIDNDFFPLTTHTPATSN